MRRSAFSWRSGSALRGSRRSAPPLAALLFVVAILLVFNLSSWRYLRWLKEIMRDDLIDRLASVAMTTGISLSQPEPPEVLQRAAGGTPEEITDYLDEFIGSYEYLGLVEKLVAVQRANRLSRLVLMTSTGLVLADSMERRHPGETYEFLELDQAEMLKAIQGGPTATQLYRISGVPYLRLYSPLRSQGRSLGLIQVSVSPEYQDKVDRMQEMVGRQWFVSSLLLLTLGLSLWRLFRYLVQVEERAVQGARVDAMGALAGNVAHELRNPLQIIRTLSEEIESETRAHPVARQNAQDIIEEVGRLNELVSNFLSLARPPGEGPASNIDTRQEIERVLALLRKGSPTGIRFTAELPAMPVYVRGEERALRQVLLNLLLNAREAIENSAGPGQVARGEIGVELRERRGRVEIRIRDTGPGVDRKTAQRLFEPFYTTKPMGTGLGLAISRGIVENLGGRIELSSTPGEGTEVLVTLPAPEAAPAAKAAYEGQGGARDR